MGSQKMRLFKIANDETNRNVAAFSGTTRSIKTPSTPIERIMGSQGIGATIETAIVLEQRPGSKDIIAHVVDKEVEGGEFAYRWDSPGFSFQGAPEVATLGSFQEKCYDFIKQHPRCMQKAIVDALDTDKGSVSRSLGLSQS